MMTFSSSEEEEEGDDDGENSSGDDAKYDDREFVEIPLSKLPEEMVDASKFVELWPKLKASGWTYARGTGCVDWYWIVPGETKKTAKLGEGMFINRVEALRCAQSRINADMGTWIPNENYNPKPKVPKKKKSKKKNAKTSNENANTMNKSAHSSSAKKRKTAVLKSLEKAATKEQQ